MTTAAPDGPTTGALARGAWHLGRARREAGRSLESLAEASGISVEELRLAEAGWRAITEEEKCRLAAALDLTPDQLVPPRMPVQVDPGRARLLMGEHSAELGADRRSTLSSYLSLVYTSRGAKPGDRIQLRDDDLDALAALVGDDPAVIETYLVDLMGCTPEEARRLGALLLRRRVLGAAAGLVFTVGGLAALGGAGRDEPRAELASLAVPAAPRPVLDAASSTVEESRPAARLGDSPTPPRSTPAEAPRSAVPPAPAVPPEPVPVPVPAPPADGSEPAGDPGPLLTLLVPPLPEMPAGAPVADQLPPEPAPAPPAPGLGEVPPPGGSLLDTPPVEGRLPDAVELPPQPAVPPIPPVPLVSPGRPANPGSPEAPGSPGVGWGVGGTPPGHGRPR